MECRPCAVEFVRRCAVRPCTGTVGARWSSGPRRRHRRRQGKGRTLRRLPRRKRHFADREHSLAGGQPDQFIQWQLVFFRAGARKNEQMQPIVEQINNEDIRNLGAYFASLTPPKAAQPDDNPDLSQKGRAGRRRTALRLVPHRYLRRHQGGGPHRRPARGISGQGAARLQVRRAIRRRHGGDGRRRLSPQRRRDHRAGALSRASLRLWTSARAIPAGLRRGSSPPLLLIRLEMRVGDAQLRHRHLGGVAARDQVADHVIGFDRRARP